VYLSYLVSATGKYLCEWLTQKLLGYSVSERLLNRHFRLQRYLVVWWPVSTSFISYNLQRLSTDLLFQFICILLFLWGVYRFACCQPGISIGLWQSKILVNANSVF